MEYKVFLENINNCNYTRISKSETLRYMEKLISEKRDAYILPLLKNQEITFNEVNKACNTYFLYKLWYGVDIHNFQEVITNFAKVPENQLSMMGSLGEYTHQELFKDIINIIKPTRTELLHTVNAIIKNRGLTTLKWFIVYYKITREEILSNVALHRAVSTDYVRLIVWLIDYFKLTQEELSRYKKSLLQTAASKGCLEALRYLARRLNMNHDKIIANKNIIFSEAASGGQIPILKWLTDQYELTKDDITADQFIAFQDAAFNGHLDVLKWLTKRFKLETSDLAPNISLTMVSVAGQGRLEVLKWLKEQFNLDELITNDILKRAIEAASQHDETIKWLRTNFIKKETTIIDDIINTISNSPLENRNNTFLLFIYLRDTLTTNEIREIIDGVCCDGRTLSDRFDANTVEIIANAYDFKRKTHEEAVSIITKMYSYDNIRKGVIDYLMRFNYIPPETPKITIEEVRRLFPGYIIAKPEEISKYLAKMH